MVAPGRFRQSQSSAAIPAALLNVSFAPTCFAATLLVAGLIAGRVRDYASRQSMAKRTSSAELRTPSF